jgi:hypothetical protein
VIAARVEACLFFLDDLKGFDDIFCAPDTGRILFGTDQHDALPKR